MNSNPSANSQFEQAVNLITQAERIVLFTGAGMSASSGIATFRDEGGFWKRFPPEQYANWKGLIQKAFLEPAKLAEFLIAVLEPVAQAVPNSAHMAISTLEKHKSVEIITQNIDRLHQAVGSEKVHEIHGSLFEIVHYPGGTQNETLTPDDLLAIVDELKVSREMLWSGPKLLSAIRPLLGASLTRFHRPNLVLFGDQLAEPAWSNAMKCAAECDLFISIGTSSTVYPAARLPDVAQEHGATLITIDPQNSGDGIWIPEVVEEVFPRLIAAAFHAEDDTDE